MEILHALNLEVFSAISVSKTGSGLTITMKIKGKKEIPLLNAGSYTILFTPREDVRKVYKQRDRENPHARLVIWKRVIKILRLLQ